MYKCTEHAEQRGQTAVERALHVSVSHVKFVCVQALQLAQMLEAADDWPAAVHDILGAFEDETGRDVVYTVVFL